MSWAINKAERLKRLEEILLNAPDDGYSAPEMAQLLGVHRSSVWRDLNEMDHQGIPIQFENDRYWIERHSYLSNVRLTSGESLMLYLAMRHQARRLTHIPPAMISAMEKLALALRHPLSDRLRSMSHQMHLESPPDSQRSGIWDTLVRGWYEGIAVRFWYRKFESEQDEERTLHPYLFEPALLSEGVYIIGYSPSHQDLRTYKVERIARAMLTTERFTPPADLDVNDLLEHSWGIWYRQELHTVRLRFADPRVARRVKETRWHPSQVIDDLPQGGIIWSVQVGLMSE